MRTALFTSAFICICALQATAADTTNNQMGAGKNVEQKKTEIIQHIQERIANSQAEITCVKSAQSHDELKACREKYRPAQRRDNRNQNLSH